MWVKFTADFDWRQERRVVIAYKAGMALNVTRVCGQAAIAAGKAEHIPTPGIDHPVRINPLAGKTNGG